VRCLCAGRAVGRGGFGDGRVGELATVHKFLCICAANGAPAYTAAMR